VKLLFAIKTMDSRGGGAERVLTQIVAEMAERGHDVTLVSFDAPDSPDFYPVDGRVHRVWLNAGRGRARTSVGDLLKRVAALRRVCRDRGPDVAIGFMQSAYVPLAIALVGTRIPVVASEHIVVEHYSRLIDRLSIRATAGLYRAVVVVAPGTEVGFPRAFRRNAVVIPNPVVPSGEMPADPVGTRRQRLLNVGRLTAQKDQHTLISAFARLVSKHPDWDLRIVGGGELEQDLKFHAETLGVGSRVELTGPKEDVWSEFAAAQIFVMSSRYESFGIATAEALSAGLPAIGFADCPGTNSIIQHKVNGLLVDGVDRVSALARGLDELMGDLELRRRLGHAAPGTVRQFALDAIVHKWDELLRRLAAHDH
jgi:glycosyltransferase involved in cell wall biosynthesis